jgi:hypothetical protein
MGAAVREDKRRRAGEPGGEAGDAIALVGLPAESDGEGLAEADDDRHHQRRRLAHPYRAAVPLPVAADAKHEPAQRRGQDVADEHVARLARIRIDVVRVPDHACLAVPAA